MFYFLQSTLSPSLRAKRGNPAPPPVIASEVKQSSPPGIKFGGHFHLPDSSEVKFGGHSCIIDLSDTQIWGNFCIIDLSDTLIWGSFLHHRPVRHPNLGVKLPVPHKLHTPLLPKPTSQSESPHLFFTVPRGDHRESSRKRSGGQEEDTKGNGNLVPLPQLLFTFKLHSLP